MFENETVLLLTKLLPIFVYPLGLGIVLTLLGGLSALLQRPRLSVSCITAALLLLWVSSMPATAEWVLSTLERQYPETPIADLPKADVAIVLGGALGQPVAPRITADLSDASDRVLYAARLYRAGKVQRILVTGGNLPWEPRRQSEAELIEALLVEWGVPQQAIEIAGASRNTYENALEIKAMWDRSPFASALLVTSAVHMPRALAVFRRAELPVAPATTDIAEVYARTSAPAPWLPNAEALALTTRAAKEWIGIWAYGMRGYL